MSFVRAFSNHYEVHKRFVYRKFIVLEQTIVSHLGDCCLQYMYML